MADRSAFSALRNKLQHPTRNKQLPVQNPLEPSQIAEPQKVFPSRTSTATTNIMDVSEEIDDHAWEIVRPAPCDHGARKGCCIPCYMQSLTIPEFQPDPYHRKRLVPKLPSGRLGLRKNAFYDDTSVYFRSWSQRNKHYLVDPECNPKSPRRLKLRVRRYNRQESIPINSSDTKGLCTDPPSSVICGWDKDVQGVAEERRKSTDQIVAEPAKETDPFWLHLFINLVLFPALCFFSFYVLTPVSPRIETFALFIKGIFGA